MLGYSRDEVIGKHYSTVVFDDDRELVRFVFDERRSDNRAAANVEGQAQSEACAPDADLRKPLRGDHAQRGGHLWRGTGRPDGPTMGTYGVARGRSRQERKIAEETISFRAPDDHLTQLPNRDCSRTASNSLITQARRHARMVGVMFVDLDRFKLVNDTWRRRGRRAAEERGPGVAASRPGRRYAEPARAATSSSILLPDQPAGGRRR
ncbi:MAG: diguanylate cyclase [Rhodocyclaceae bacterium]|nr:diguanylate cyclase [Rhodocyclaceae bacterium]